MGTPLQWSPFVVHYINNFLIPSLPGSTASSTMRSIVEAIINKEPYHYLTFFGILIDTISFQLSLPEKKVQCLHEQLILEEKQ